VLDEIFEMFDRDKKKRPTGKRSLLSRVTDAISDRDHRPYEDHSDRRYADERRRPNDDRYERRRDDDDDDRPRYADDRGGEYHAPSKKKRFADLLEFD
jgi:hypothetical protein